MTRLWEQHTCLPLDPAADITELARYPEGSYMSVNIGYSPHCKALAADLAQQWRARMQGDGRFRAAVTVTDIDDAWAAGTARAVAFDLEDSGPLEEDLANVQYFYDLGVRSLLPSYNFANTAGCGCLDASDTGLTSYGRDLIREMNRVGMFTDGSHCSAKTGLDIAETTEKPMIYSHSNFRALWEHPRNITDEQARECARTGGVIGINGVGIFLGANDPAATDERVQKMADHIEYGAALVGVEHIGLGTDYSFDPNDFNDAIAAHPETFSEVYTRWGPLQWVPPEDSVTLDAVLRDRGWAQTDVAAVFGGNFRRIAGEVWATGE